MLLSPLAILPSVPSSLSLLYTFSCLSLPPLQHFFASSVGENFSPLSFSWSHPSLLPLLCWQSGFSGLMNLGGLRAASAGLIRILIKERTRPDSHLPPFLRPSPISPIAPPPCPVTRSGIFNYRCSS